jgi:Glycosyl hydrolases family 16
MTTDLIYPENCRRKVVIKMTLSLLVVICVLSPFLLQTYTKIFVKEIVFIINDDFKPCYYEGCINGGIDYSTWNFEVGDGSQYSSNQGGWGNNEVQCYTDRYENVHIEPNPDKKGDGMLVISSIYNENDTNCKWTSGRITTKHKKNIVPAKDKYNEFCISAEIEARMKIPRIGGSWSSFWMLPEPPKMNRSCLGCGVYGSWCNSGEIDIMEHRDVETKVFTNIRYNSSTEACANNPVLSQEIDLAKWHTYKLHWTCDSVTWYIDNIPITTWKPSTNSMKPFDQPFYLIFNLAIGGEFSNYKKPEEINGTMYIDWVKAYYV